MVRLDRPSLWPQAELRLVSEKELQQTMDHTSSGRL
jgi:hypothetical protein